MQSRSAGPHSIQHATPRSLRGCPLVRGLGRQRSDASFPRGPRRLVGNTSSSRPSGNRPLVNLDFDLRKVHRRNSVLGEKRRKRRRTTGRKACEVVAVAFDRQVAMCLGDTCERCRTEHSTNAGSIFLRHFIDTDSEPYFRVTAVLRDICEKPVLGTASAASLLQNGQWIVGVCCSTVRQRPHVFRQVSEALEPATADVFA
jgi:hypothetical protein